MSKERPIRPMSAEDKEIILTACKRLKPFFDAVQIVAVKENDHGTEFASLGLGPDFTRRYMCNVLGKDCDPDEDDEEFGLADLEEQADDDLPM